MKAVNATIQRSHPCLRPARQRESLKTKMFGRLEATNAVMVGCVLLAAAGVTYTESLPPPMQPRVQGNAAVGRTRHVIRLFCSCKDAQAKRTLEHVRVKPACSCRLCRRNRNQ